MCIDPFTFFLLFFLTNASSIVGPFLLVFVSWTYTNCALAFWSKLYNISCYIAPLLYFDYCMCDTTVLLISGSILPDSSCSPCFLSLHGSILSFALLCEFFCIILIFLYYICLVTLFARACLSFLFRIDISGPPPPPTPPHYPTEARRVSQRVAFFHRAGYSKESIPSGHGTLCMTDAPEWHLSYVRDYSVNGTMCLPQCLICSSRIAYHSRNKSMLAPNVTYKHISGAKSKWQISMVPILTGRYTL